MIQAVQKKVWRRNSTTFYYGVAIILLVVGTIFGVSRSPAQNTIQFGKCHLRTEIARTAHEKALGLSGRNSLSPDFAMVFPFDNEKPFFWMKDMLISVDMVWLDKTKVVKVDSNVPVDDGAIAYQAPIPIDWVIEVAAGRSDQCQVKPGTIIHGLRD